MVGHGEDDELAVDRGVPPEFAVGVPREDIVDPFLAVSVEGV